jgi:hypothetical protein
LSQRVLDYVVKICEQNFEQFFLQYRLLK